MKIWLIQVLVPGLKILGAMLANPAKRFLMVIATLLLSFLLFSSTPIYAQPPTVPLQSEPGDRTYTRNLFFRCVCICFFSWNFSPYLHAKSQKFVK
jgi:hypothetical protein